MAVVFLVNEPAEDAQELFDLERAGEDAERAQAQGFVEQAIDVAAGDDGAVDHDDRRGIREFAEELEQLEAGGVGELRALRPAVAGHGDGEIDDRGVNADAVRDVEGFLAGAGDERGDSLRLEETRELFDPMLFATGTVLGQEHVESGVGMRATFMHGAPLGE